MRKVPQSSKAAIVRPRVSCAGRYKGEEFEFCSENYIENHPLVKVFTVNIVFVEYNPKPN